MYTNKSRIKGIMHFFLGVELQGRDAFKRVVWLARKNARRRVKGLSLFASRIVVRRGAATDKCVGVRALRLIYDSHTNFPADSGRTFGGELSRPRPAPSDPKNSQYLKVRHGHAKKRVSSQRRL